MEESKKSAPVTLTDDPQPHSRTRNRPPSLGTGIRPESCMGPHPWACGFGGLEDPEPFP